MNISNLKSELSSKSTLKDKVSHAMLFLTVMVLTSNTAFADLDGGLGKAESTAMQIKDWLIKIFGIVAVIYILWKGVETWRNRGDWGDFTVSACYVAIVGAAPAIANWAWTVFH